MLTALAGEAIAEDILTGHSARLERLGCIAPKKFSDNAFIAKMQLIGENIIPVLKSFFSKGSPHPAPKPAS